MLPDAPSLLLTQGWGDGSNSTPKITHMRKLLCFLGIHKWVYLNATFGQKSLRHCQWCTKNQRWDDRKRSWYTYYFFKPRH